MKEEWWEQPVCFVCDYWWALLLALALLLTGWFTRGYWLPLLGVTPAPTPAPTTSSPSALATVTPTSELYGYINEEGKYAFNYPSNWKGEEIGPDAYFQLPNNARLEIIVKDLLPGETFETLVEDTGPLSIPKSNLSDVSIGGEAAQRYDVLNEQNEMIARAYQVLHNGRAYYLTLFAPPNPGSDSFAQSLEQLDQLILDFQFLP